MIHKKTFQKENIFAHDIDQSKKNICEELGINWMNDSIEIIKKTKIIIICVKPFSISQLCKEIYDFVDEEHLIVSILAVLFLCKNRELE